MHRSISKNPTKVSHHLPQHIIRGIRCRIEHRTRVMVIVAVYHELGVGLANACPSVRRGVQLDHHPYSTMLCIRHHLINRLGVVSPSQAECSCDTQLGNPLGHKRPGRVAIHSPMQHVEFNHTHGVNVILDDVNREEMVRGVDQQAPMTEPWPIVERRLVQHEERTARPVMPTVADVTHFEDMGTLGERL